MLDPLTIFSILLFNIGSRYLTIELTEVQKKIIKTTTFQMLLLFIIIYFSTKSFITSFVVVIIFYLLINFLLNENSKYNLYSKKWLFDIGILDLNEENIESLKNIYNKNIEKIKNL